MGLFSKKPEVPEGGILLHVDAGRSYFGSAVGTAGALKLMQHPSGAVFVYGKNGPLVFTIIDYEWDGPEYETITTTKENVSHKSTEKSRTKRTGRMTGAIVGSLIMPGVGTAIGAMVGTGNKKGKAKTIGAEQRTGTTTTREVETSTVAYMTLKNVQTKETFTFSFLCNSKINVEMMNIVRKAGLA